MLLYRITHFIEWKSCVQMILKWHYSQCWIKWFFSSRDIMEFQRGVCVYGLLISIKFQGQGGSGRTFRFQWRGYRRNAPDPTPWITYHWLQYNTPFPTHYIAYLNIVLFLCISPPTKKVLSQLHFLSNFVYVNCNRSNSIGNLIKKIIIQ